VIAARISPERLPAEFRSMNSLIPKARKGFYLQTSPSPVSRLKSLENTKRGEEFQMRLSQPSLWRYLATAICIACFMVGPAAAANVSYTFTQDGWSDQAGDTGTLTVTFFGTAQTNGALALMDLTFRKPDRTARTPLFLTWQCHEFFLRCDKRTRVCRR
jgi:hypothetical protein